MRKAGPTGPDLARFPLCSRRNAPSGCSTSLTFCVERKISPIRTKKDAASSRTREAQAAIWRRLITTSSGSRQLSKRLIEIVAPIQNPIRVVSFIEQKKNHIGVNVTLSIERDAHQGAVRVSSLRRRKSAGRAQCGDQRLFVVRKARALRQRRAESSRRHARQCGKNFGVGVEDVHLALAVVDRDERQHLVDNKRRNAEHKRQFERIDERALSRRIGQSGGLVERGLLVDAFRLRFFPP